MSSEKGFVNKINIRGNGKNILPEHDDLIMNGWALVRHCPAGVRWHQATDHLHGTAEYGDPTLGDHPSAPEWSKKFDTARFDEFLFTTGDGSRWMVVDRSEIVATDDSDLKPLKVTRSSINPRPHTVKYLNCSKHPHEPWIGLQDHENSKSDDGAGFLYGGGSFNVSPVEDSSQEDGNQALTLAATDSSSLENKTDEDNSGYQTTILPEEFGMVNIRFGGGSNVYIRSKQNCHLAACLDSDNEVGQDILMSMNNDDGLHRLWRKNPASILSGLSHSFFHGEILEWLEREIDDSTHPEEKEETVPAVGRSVVTSSSRMKSSVKMARVAGADCVDDFNWVRRCGRDDLIKAITDLDGLTHADTHDTQERSRIKSAEVRGMLLSLVFKGLIVGPLRSCFEPVREIGMDLGGDWKWCGACKAQDGRLFFLPRNAPEFKVLVFDPAFGTTRFLSFPKEVRRAGYPITGQKYNGACVGADGAIYGIPACALRVLRIDPNTNTCAFIGMPRRGSWKWGQGCLAPNGVIYAAPCNEHTVLCIDTNLENQNKTNNVSMLELPPDIISDGSDSASFSSVSKWWGATYVPSAINKRDSLVKEAGSESTSAEVSVNPAVLVGDATTNLGDFVYFTPKNMRRVLKLNVYTKEMALVGDNLMSGGEKFLGACYTGGYIVCCPANRGSRKIMLFDPVKETTQLVGPDLGGAHFKWHDSVVGADGGIYGLPHHADSAIMVDLKLAVESMAAAAASSLSSTSGEGGGGTGTSFSHPPSSSGSSLTHEGNKDDAGNNGCVKFLEPSLGADGGRYGCGVLADDGYVYAAPMFANRMLRIDTLPSIPPPTPARYVQVGSQIHYYGDEVADNGEGSMLWIWRNHPELWFMGLCHPIYGQEFLDWFQKESSENFRDDSKEENENDLSTLTLEMQCGIRLKLKDKELSLKSSQKKSSTSGDYGYNNKYLSVSSEAGGTAGEVGNGIEKASSGANYGSQDKKFVYASHDKNLSLFNAAAVRVSRINDLVGHILNIPEHLRKKLLKVPVLRSAFISPDTVGPWILTNLMNSRSRRTQAKEAEKLLEYFQLVSAIDGYKALALPWANVKPLDMNADVVANLEWKSKSMRERNSVLSASGGGTNVDPSNSGGWKAHSKDKKGPKFVVLEEDDDNDESEGVTLEEEKEVLTFGNHMPGSGWAWKWWEKYDVSLEWGEWKHLVEKKHGGRLLTLREAREILEYKTLCPGEDRWVAVMEDIQGKRVSKKGKVKYVSSHLAADALKNRRLVEDWVQVGDLSCPPGTSLKAMPQLRQQLLKRSKFTPGDWTEKKEFLRTDPAVCMWKPMGLAEGPLLLQAILAVKDEAIRSKLMETKLMHAVLLRTETVGPWIVDGLAGKQGQRYGIVTYMVEASSVDKEDILTEAFASLPNLFPAMLQLPAVVQEAAVSTPLFTKVMDMKLAERPIAVAIVCADIVLVGLLLGLFLGSCGNIHALKTPHLPAAGLSIVFILNSYFFTRECYQMKTMTSLGLAVEYWTNWWNINDMLGSLCTYTTFCLAVFGGRDTRISSFYRFFAAVTSIFLWLKVLSSVKVLNIKLATFVYSLNLIMRDLSEFVLVMAIVIMMFSFMFTIINADGSDEGLDFDLEDLRPFHSPSYSMMSCYMMIMGMFEREWFEVDGSAGLTAFSVALFIIFMFFVVIVMLNVLIAVVSDSYDFAMTKAKQLFLTTRLVLVAELDSLGISDESFLPVWADRYLLRFGRLPIVKIITDALHVKSESAAGHKAETWTGRVLHMESLTQKIVDKKVNDGVATILEHLKVQEARISDVEKRIARRLGQLEAARKREREQMETYEKSNEKHQQFMKDQQLQRKFDDLSRKQQESEKRILQALKSKP